jgi:hypothetical protein
VDGASLSAIKTTGFDMFFDPYGNWSDQWLVISGGSSSQVTKSDQAAGIGRRAHAFKSPRRLLEVIL